MIHIDRVIVSPQGDATTPEKAQTDYNVVPDVVFVRDDGWTLGAPKKWEKVAYDLWKDYWIKRIPVKGYK
jgi:hypothetical protein